MLVDVMSCVLAGSTRVAGSLKLRAQVAVDVKTADLDATTQCRLSVINPHTLNHLSIQFIRKQMLVC